jgi:hypothetical protein
MYWIVLGMFKTSAFFPGTAGRFFKNLIIFISRNKSKLDNIFQIDKSQVRITTVKEQGNDFAYWQTQPAWKRLAALESIRREYHAWKYGTPEPRFQKVYSITQRS